MSLEDFLHAFHKALTVCIYLYLHLPHVSKRLVHILNRTFTISMYSYLLHISKSLKVTRCVRACLASTRVDKCALSELLGTVIPPLFD